MIYIGATNDNGSAIYFDVYSAVPQGRRGLSISATIGDGSYEGEVLVELGGSDSVTFADAWLGGSGFAEFMDRCGSQNLERAVLDSVREMPLFRSRRNRPHGNAAPLGGSRVAESVRHWPRGA